MTPMPTTPTADFGPEWEAVFLRRSRTMTIATTPAAQAAASTARMFAASSAGNVTGESAPASAAASGYRVAPAPLPHPTQRPKDNFAHGESRRSPLSG